MNEIKDGLCNLPIPIYLYVKYDKTEQGISNWYTYDQETQLSTAVYQNAVLGKLTDIKVTKHKYKNDFNYKVNFYISYSTGVFVVRSGIETTFSRGILLAINNIQPEALDDQFYFGTAPGDDTVYGKLYTKSGERVLMTWDAEVKLLPIVNKLQAILGLTEQTIKIIDEEYARRNTNG